MAGFEMTTWIDAPRDFVFGLLSDSSKASKIMPNIESMQQLTDGPVGVGTKFREKRHVNGKLEETELEVTRYEPDAHYAVTAEANAIQVTYHYALTAEGSGTRVDLTCKVEGSGVKKLMLPVVAAFMKKEDGEHLERLKKFTEAEQSRA